MDGGAGIKPVGQEDRAVRAEQRLPPQQFIDRGETVGIIQNCRCADFDLYDLNRRPARR